MAQVSWVRSLGLAVLLLALGTFAYWLEYSHKPKKEEREEQAKKLLDLKDTQIATLRIVDQSRDGVKPLVFKCLDIAANLCKPSDNSKWELTSPMKVKADESNVNSFLSSLSGLTSSETIDLSGETADKRARLLKEYRLDQDARKDSSRATGVRRVDITSAKGETLSAYLGEASPVGDSVFAISGKDESRVYLVPSYLKSHFEHDLTYWRDKKVFSASAAQIQGFEVDSAKLKARAVRKDGQWAIKSGGDGGDRGELPGDIENIESFLSGVMYVTAKQFVAENKADAVAQSMLKGAKKIVSFSIEVPNKISFSLFEKQIQNKKGDGKSAGKSKDKDKNESVFYATLSNLDPVFEMDSSVKSKFEKTLKDFRLSKLITTMERYNAKRMEFAGKPIGAKPLILAQDESKADSKWVQMPEKAAVDNDKIQALLDKLSGNRIQEFLEASAIPTGEQEGVQVILSDAKSEKKRQLAFWKSSEKLYARDLLSNRKEAFLVDVAVKDALPWNKDFLSMNKPVPEAVQSAVPIKAK